MAGIGLAYLLDPLATRMERMGMNRCARRLIDAGLRMAPAGA